MNTEQLIDELEEIIYVSDLDTYELLYLNRAGRDMLGADYAGERCYRFLQGQEAPCPFCTNAYLKEHSVTRAFYCWEHTNEHSGGHHYLLKDKLIPWEGRAARMELAVDITERENLSKSVREKLEVESVLVECIRALVDEKRLSKAIDIVLSHLGEFYQADRAYIFECDEPGYLRNTYEWCAQSVIPQIDRLQQIGREDVQTWIDAFSQHQSIRIDNLEKEADHSSALYLILSAQNIKSLIAVPLWQEGRLWGLIGVDNPVRMIEDTSVLDSLAYFIAEFVQKQKIQDEMKRLSYQDFLTGLCNRYQYMETLRKLTERPPQKVGVACLDIDGLKKINETYGHAYGDQFIIETANILRRFFPEEDAYRIGGDEFVVISVDCAYENFTQSCTALKQAFSEEDKCSVSMGYIWSDWKIDITGLIASADELMHLKKQKAYQSNRLSSFHHKPLLLDNLLKSIEEGEFDVFLQIKVDARMGTPFGAEALVRQHSPQRGLVYPGSFINMLEQESIVKYIDFYVCEQVCRLLERWKREGRRLMPISVNFSRVTLMEPDFLEQILSMRNRYQIPAEMLALEITESTDKMGYDNMIRMVTELRKNGFRIDLDDFGTKYTSLSLFTEMDVDMVKLDKSLVDGLEINAKSRLIVKDAIQMCRELGFQSIAEGVETPRQMEILQVLGCDYLQGYLFSKPIPIKEFEEKYAHALSPR